MQPLSLSPLCRSLSIIPLHRLLTVGPTSSPTPVKLQQWKHSGVASKPPIIPQISNSFELHWSQRGCFFSYTGRIAAAGALWLDFVRLRPIARALKD
ncbi:unnamed protein product [Ilex paraguariensis]|uniref:Uncharacterized protein n=1 Tax=Ilex paraguariensis TaxID=185542 RepID=A0ABC8RFZ1_9AQUA